MILKAYLKKRLKLLALLCAFALIFALVLWASALPAGACWRGRWIFWPFAAPTGPCPT